MSEWISVEDRLPKNGQRVRVYGRYWGEIYDEGDMITAEGNWWEGSIELPADAYAAGVKDITYWHPLIAAPDSAQCSDHVDRG